jgi:uncharacterized delta-60 repeat protein
MLPPYCVCSHYRWTSVFAAILYSGISLSAAPPGAVDGTFDPARGPNKVVGGSGSSLLLQPDGKFLVGGQFNAVNLAKVDPIVRFNSNGSRDTSFNVPSIEQLVPIDPSFFSAAPLALLSNGKILVGGTFDTADGMHHHLVRLKADGSLDTNFNPQIVSTTEEQLAGVSRAIVQADGKILIAGAFDRVNNVARRSFARLNANGTLDTTFNPSLSGVLLTFAQQIDGKILVASRSPVQLMRLNTDGTRDMTFVSQYASPDGQNSVSSILIQSDGKIVVSGPDGWIEGYYMSRLISDGKIDETFQSNRHLGIALQRDGRILSYAQSFVFQRVNADGSFDSSFQFNDGFVEAVVEQPDGRLILAGDIPSGLDQVFSDGSHDPSSTIGVGLTIITTAALDHVQLLPNGNIVMAGDFNHVNLLPRNRIAVLTPDGLPDAGFDAGNVTVIGLFGFDVDNLVNALAVESDGKILIGFYNRVVRLNQNGTVDPTFNYHPVGLGLILAIAVQKDGKILVGKEDGLIRLRDDGILDQSFDAGQTGDVVSRFLIQPDGKTIVSRHGLIRLNQNGSPDSSFDSRLGEFNFANPLALLPDGKILVN